MPHADPEAKRRYHEQYREKNRAKSRCYAKTYYASNKQQMIEQHKAYYAANGERIRERVRNYSRKNRAALGVARRKRVQKDLVAWLKSKLLFLRAIDKRDGKTCDLTVVYLVQMYEAQGGKCAFSGLEMTHKMHDLCAVSVDRIDNSLGHTKGNVQLVCRWANMGRGKHTVAEFREVIARIKEQCDGCREER